MRGVDNHDTAEYHWQRELLRRDIQRRLRLHGAAAIGALIVSIGYVANLLLEGGLPTAPVWLLCGAVVVLLWRVGELRREHDAVARANVTAQAIQDRDG